MGARAQGESDRHLSDVSRGMAASRCGGRWRRHQHVLVGSRVWPHDALRGLLPRIPSASYSAAKAGIEALTRYMASIGARHHIRVNCVRPGQIETPHLIGEEGGHVFKRYFDIVQILPGPGRADDVSDAALFLASDEARFITAEILNIDGGTAGKV